MARIVRWLRSVWYAGLMRWSPLIVLIGGWWLADPDSVIRLVTSVLAVVVAALQPRCACHERATELERQVGDWDAAFSAIMPDGQPPRGHRVRTAA